ncbi:uncharacterized protein LOC102717316 isoform X2 [Oryza brachyantha]|uniref:Uncharacterized protein n=1 Tax=Oryza brachyantha TaxID=4533 RepID=J3LGD8_ORYBR|nr:uncharacterized protein LOC102717316 isoform X2 [Oryza brachyantha]
MEGFHGGQSACPQSEQHSDHVSDSVEDAISDEDVLAPTRLSLAFAASKEREKENKMVEQDESAIWDEVLEEADELAYVHKVPPSISFLSAGTGKRRKSENKLKFSIRGSSSVSLNVKTENSYVGEQKTSSGVPTNGAPENMMAELMENIKEETEDLPSEFACPTKKANISISELLDNLQDRSASSVGTPFSLHQHTAAKEDKPKVPTSKRTLALLGQRNLEIENPLGHIIGETSSEEEDNVENNLALINKDVKGQTMADIFQQVFNATSMDCSTLPVRSYGAGYYGRMQQILQMEKDRHAEFLRQYNREQDCLGDSRGITVQILSRSLEGKLTICRCLFMEKSSLPSTGDVSTDCAMDGSSMKRTIIFSPKICDSVDLVAGNIIHIFPPWKEVKVKEETVLLCTYFSRRGR